MPETIEAGEGKIEADLGAEGAPPGFRILNIFGRRRRPKMLEITRRNEIKRKSK